MASDPAAPDPATGRDRPLPRILRLAHRGDWRQAPENSLSALVAGALAPRSDGLEFDVHLARDGTPVVIHDSSLARVQGFDGRVATMDPDALAALDVPTLVDVLAAVPRTAFLDVELKVAPNRAVATALQAARGLAPSDAVVSSFQSDALRTAHDLLPNWRRWLNSHRLDSETVGLAVSVGCQAVAADWQTITPVTAQLVFAAGLELAAFTVRREPTVRRLARLGVGAVCVEGRPLD